MKGGGNRHPAYRRLPDSAKSPGFLTFERSEIDQSIPDRFEKIVRLYPRRTALRSGDVAFDYASLNGKANRLARALQDCGTKDDAPIALLTDQGPSNVTAVLAVLKSGRFFLPLDSQQPMARNRLIIEESGAQTLITDGANLHKARTVSGNMRQLVDVEDPGKGFSSDDLQLDIDPDSIAQIVYTSGSTGIPKGVVHTHRQVLHNVMRHTNTFLIHSGDRQSLLYPPHAYAGTREIYNALLNGACLCHFPVMENPSGLSDWVQDEGITIYCSVTTVFRFLLDRLATATTFPHLRVIKLGGESTFRKDIENLRNKIESDCYVHCGLGISETGLSSHYFFDRHHEIPGEKVPLGYPSLDVDLKILDEERQPIRQGSVGEIAVKSRYIASGYWRRDDLTRAKFLRDSTDREARTYLTGDLGCIHPDGALEYRGRMDQQVKIRGNRVDLSEIEARLVATPSVKEAAVLVREDARGQSHLVAYWTPVAEQVLGHRKIREVLLKFLPVHAVPLIFVKMERMPMTPTGKINKRALPDPQQLD